MLNDNTINEIQKALDNSASEDDFKTYSNKETIEKFIKEDLLSQFINSADYKLQKIALEVLNEIEPMRAVKLLVCEQINHKDHWGHENYDDHGSVVLSPLNKYLSNVKNVTVVDTLINWVTDEKEDTKIRESAADFLGEIKNQKAVEPLSQVLLANTSCSKNKLVQSREEIENDSPSVHCCRPPENEKKCFLTSVIIALTNIGSNRPVQALINALNDGNRCVRKYAVNALGEIGDVIAIKPLVQTLQKDKDDLVRGRAAWALGKIGDTKVIKYLIRALKTDKKKYVQMQAAWALGDIGDLRTVKPLILALNETKGLALLGVKYALTRLAQKMKTYDHKGLDDL